MGAHKGCRVEAQAPREPYFTREAMAITSTHMHSYAHTHTHTHTFLVAGGYDRVELGAKSRTLHTGILIVVRRLDGDDERVD